MFTKLLKQEWRATRGFLGLLCLICLGAAVLGGGAIRYLVWMSMQEADMTLGIVLCALALVAAVLSLSVCGAASVVLVVARFYKSRFTDEGYLTFTLPVTAHENLLSSLANSAICVVLACVTILVCLAGMLVFGFSGVEAFRTAFQDDFTSLFRMIGDALGKEPALVVLMALNLVFGLVCELVVLMLSVTIGSVIAKKHKIIAAVAVCYGIHLGLSIVDSALMVGQGVAALEGANMGVTFFASSAALSLAIAVGGYFLTHRLISKRLNLN